MKRKSDEVGLEEAQLSLITDSFFNAQENDPSNPLIADRKKLLFKIVDILKTTETQAKRLLNILESRNVVEVGKLEVRYNQRFHNKRAKEKALEINNLFNNLKK